MTPGAATAHRSFNGISTVPGASYSTMRKRFIIFVALGVIVDNLLYGGWMTHHIAQYVGSYFDYQRGIGGRLTPV